MDKHDELACVQGSKVAHVWLQRPANVDESKGDSSNFEFVGRAAFEDGDVERGQDRWKWRAGEMAMTR